MSNQQYQYLAELMELVQKTGERCVVMPNGDAQPLVLLTLENYKQLLDNQKEEANSKLDELVKQLRSLIDANPVRQQLNDDNQNSQKKRLAKDETYTNIEEFEIKRRLYADLMDGYKSEPIFQ